MKKSFTMSVRAKFVCKEITRRKHWDPSKGEVQSVKLEPVTSGSEENKAFYEATPSGSIQLDTLNENAGKYFELGKSYYLDFKAAE
jgi:hypothetical protein